MLVEQGRGSGQKGGGAERGGIAYLYGTIYDDHHAWFSHFHFLKNKFGRDNDASWCEEAEDEE